MGFQHIAIEVNAIPKILSTTKAHIEKGRMGSYL